MVLKCCGEQVYVETDKMHKPKKQAKRGIIQKPKHGKHAVPEELRMTSFTDCTYIEGVTLTRYMRLDNGENPEQCQFVVRELSPLDYEEFCDGCVSYHQKNNMECNKTLGTGSTFATREGVLYDFRTKKPTRVKLIPVDEVWVPHSKIHLLTCKMTIY